jgi:hypothetical protein
MDSLTIDKIKHTSNTEVVRRLMIKYFMDKGFVESFDRQMCPCLIQDLPMVIPILANKIEIVPHAEEVDPAMGKAVLGWNLFVLGSKRMYLGETYHSNLQDLARQIQSGLIMIPEEGGGSSRRQTTPRRIISFITRVMQDMKSGYVDLNMSSQMGGDPYSSNNTMSGSPQQFYSRSGYGM